MRTALIIGSGRVGRTAGLVLALSGGWEVVYTDVKEEVAKAAAEDTFHAVSCRGVESTVKWSREPVDADVVIVTASAPMRNVPSTRMVWLEENAKIIADIAEKVYPAAPRAWYIIVTNPVDVIATLFARLTGSKRVVSTGTYIDSARLRCFLAKKYGAPLSKVKGMIGGIHGEDIVVLWSTIRVNGKSIEPSEELVKELTKYVVNDPWDIVRAIGMTAAGAGTMAASIALKLAEPRVELEALAPYDGCACIGAPCAIGCWSIEQKLCMLPEDERREVLARREKVLRISEEVLEKLSKG